MPRAQKNIYYFDFQTYCKPQTCSFFLVFWSWKSVNQVWVREQAEGYIQAKRKDCNTVKRGALERARDVSSSDLHLWRHVFKSARFPDAKGSIREIILPKGLDLDRPKRTRTSFTAEQLYRLEMEFQRCQYVVGRERTELARQLNLSETQVGNTFKHSSFSLRLYTVNGTLAWLP